MLFYFFSKTNWDEYPRIRHQMARMLSKRGHQVLFFQKPTYLFGARPITNVEKNIWVATVPELFHHQLKINKIIKNISDLFFEYKLKKLIQNFNEPDYIINFNYDYDFLNKIFKKKIIFIINDDFIDMAKWWMKKQAKKLELSTIRNSNCVLTVSKKIIGKYQNFSKKVHLFLPWSQNKYIKPKINKDRNTILIFGYIDNRIDWDLINYLIKSTNYNLKFVGPILDTKVRLKISEMNQFHNFSYQEPTKLDKLILNNVFCSLIPYKKETKGVDAVTLSNRTMQILSHGIPVITKEMAYTMTIDEVIFTYNSIEDLIKKTNQIKTTFQKLQNKIKLYLNKNNEVERYKYFIKIVKIS